VLRTALSRSITELLKSGIGFSVLVVGATHHSPGWQETVPICITVCTELSILMQSDVPLDEVLVTEVRLGKTYVKVRW
jgi:hypothetical protein